MVAGGTTATGGHPMAGGTGGASNGGFPMVGGAFPVLPPTAGAGGNIVPPMPAGGTGNAGIGGAPGMPPMPPPVGGVRGS
jgi:hypothetical protein